MVGVGQITDHPVHDAAYESRPHPLDLMVQALERASEDTGSTGVLGALDELVAIGSFTWHTTDPALLVAQALGLRDIKTRLTPTGGNIPQKLVHESARRILANEIDAIAVVGSEAMYASSLARKQGLPLGWLKQDDTVVAPALVEENRTPLTKDEYENGITLPVEAYPLFENARRARLGWTIDEQREQLGRLWSNFAKVAADNPYAWIRTAPNAKEIVTPSPSNRMVSFPYTKMLVANMPVDMGAAYIMMSYEKASALGIASDKMIFPIAGADATDHWFISDRPQLDSSPAMTSIWSALQSFGVRTDDLSHIDFYSCFPTVVQTACDVAGIDAFDASRIPTVTGGLTFGGGPGNNYVTHSIATMVSLLRTSQSTGLVSGLGWFSTKHAWGTYSATPPATSFQWKSVQDDVDSQPVCPHQQGNGDVTVETYTVVHNRDDSPNRLVVVARNTNGVRVWATSADPSLMNEAETTELIGQHGRVRDGLFLL
jgi:acetyl-CoA C-acetyltransferase